MIVSHCHTQFDHNTSIKSFLIGQKVEFKVLLFSCRPMNYYVYEPRRKRKRRGPRTTLQQHAQREINRLEAEIERLEALVEKLETELRESKSLANSLWDKITIKVD